MGLRELTIAVWVIDTGPLSNFAVTGHLNVLQRLAPGGRLAVPDVVAAELAQAADPLIRGIVNLLWLDTYALASDEEIEAFVRFARLLDTQKGRNQGECAVLALAEVHQWEAVIDDEPAVRRGRRQGLVVHRTGKLLCDAINQGIFTRPEGVDVVAALRDAGYRLPFGAEEFIAWAEANGLLGNAT